MNLEIYLTTVAIIGTVMVFTVLIAPVYFALYMAVIDRREKSAVQFMKDFHKTREEVKFESAVERLFDEEGEINQ